MDNIFPPKWPMACLVNLLSEPASYLHRKLTGYLFIFPQLISQTTDFLLNIKGFYFPPAIITLAAHPYLLLDSEALYFCSFPNKTVLFFITYLPTISPCRLNGRRIFKSLHL